jgi:glycerol-3-phosphate cytidylyltransferase/FAD synthetase
LDILEKTILSTIFACSLSNDSVVESIKKKKSLPEDYINSKIDNLVKNGLVESDKKSLTELGRTSLRVVLTG